MDYELDNAFSGMQFDGFRLTGKIGEGELGVVYSAVNSLGTVAACKILKPEIAQAGSAVQQFVYEAKTASKLSHPNVVKAITAGHSLGYYYFLMEYVDGVSLEKLRRDNPEIMTFDFVCDRFAELADALGYAWKNHLVTHGDIKPENILIQRDPAVLKLADLGLARVALNTASSRDVIMGTPLYIAPELVSGDISKPTVKSDVYSNGQLDFIRNYLQQVEDAIYQNNPSELAKLVDMNSLIDMYIVQEYAKNIDVGWSSFYMYRDVGGKLTFAPPWDFDLSFGNDDRLDDGSYEGLYVGTSRGMIQDHKWYNALFRYDWFQKMVRMRWRQISDTVIPKLIQAVRYAALQIAADMQKNYERWKLLGQRHHQEPSRISRLKTYQEHVDYLVQWMQNRKAWLDIEFAK